MVLVLTSSPFCFIPPWLVEVTQAGGTLDGMSTAVFPGPVTSWNETAGLGDGKYLPVLNLGQPTEDGGLWKAYGWVSLVGSTEGLDRAAGVFLVVCEEFGSSKPWVKTFLSCCLLL